MRLKKHHKTYLIKSLPVRFFFLFLTTSIFSQSPISFEPETLKAYKVDDETYNFYWHKNYINANNFYHKKEVLEGDTLPYFVDDREYKGLKNYGIQHENLNNTNHNISEVFKMYYLDVLFENIFFNTDTKTIKIKGKIKNGWANQDFNKFWLEDLEQNNIVKIFIGNRKDTLKALYYEPYSTNEYAEKRKHLDTSSTYSKLYYENGKTTKYIVKHKGVEIKEDVVLDSFPSFYLENYIFYNINNGTIRDFNIDAKIDKNSILVFSLENCYSEIFEIGKMVFDDTTIRQERVSSLTKHIQDNSSREPKMIIRYNVQELYKDTITKPEVPWYYQKIELAEDLIFKRKYKAASDEYFQIMEEKEYMYARDMHNAIRAAILSRDYKRAIYWCEKIVLKGVPLTYFNSTIFKSLKKYKGWSSFVKNHPALLEIHKKGLNQKLIDGLKELVALDQKDYHRQAIGEFDRDNLYATTENVNNFLIPLLNKEGFPSEEKVGVTMYQDTLIKRSKDYYVLIAHSHQLSSSRLPEIKQIMDKSSKNFEYDMFRNNLDKLMNMRTCYTLYKGNLYSDKNCNNEGNMLEKIKYNFQNKYGFILDQGDVGALGYKKENEEEDTKFMNDNFDFIMKLTDEMFLSY